MSKKMRIYHRYLGFFLAGIMAVYAISGIVLIFRDKNTFKKTTTYEEVLPEGTTVEHLGEALGIRRLRVEKVEDGIAYWKDGSYNLETREANYTKSELPFVLDKLTHLHKSNSSAPLAFLNVFFGVSLFFFVISTFWMFAPGSSIFRKGIYFTIGGLVLALVMLLI